MNKGILYLIPTVISPETEIKVLPPELTNLCNRLDYYLVENIRTARRCLSAMKIKQPIESLEFYELSKKTKPEELANLMKPLMKGKSIGIMSEAGCPGIADPGAAAVAYAHQNGIQVVPMVGPSSIFMALMASGFSGQSFAFHGYLPINKAERIQSIKNLEDLAIKSGQTQIFMETPYRNNHLLDDILRTCAGDIKLCVARDISGSNEFIQTKHIKNWKNKPDLHKQPCIFLLSNS
jgi:16S rRNA (cytidine1402-2'-O)-methyltransferase